MMPMRLPPPFSLQVFRLSRTPVMPGDSAARTAEPDYSGANQARGTPRENDAEPCPAAGLFGPWLPPRRSPLRLLTWEKSSCWKRPWPVFPWASSSSGAAVLRTGPRHGPPPRPGESRGIHPLRRRRPDPDHPHLPALTPPPASAFLQTGGPCQVAASPPPVLTCCLLSVGRWGNAN